MTMFLLYKKNNPELQNVQQFDCGKGQGSQCEDELFSDVYTPGKLYSCPCNCRTNRIPR